MRVSYLLPEIYLASAVPCYLVKYYGLCAVCRQACACEYIDSALQSNAYACGVFTALIVNQLSVAL